MHTRPHPTRPPRTASDGFFYNSYRLRFYYWESVLLLEKLALALVVTATQRFGAPSQVLAALGAFFVFLLVQSSCHPYGVCVWGGHYPLDLVPVCLLGRGLVSARVSARANV